MRKLHPLVGSTERPLFLALRRVRHLGLEDPTESATQLLTRSAWDPRPRVSAASNGDRTACGVHLQLRDAWQRPGLAKSKGKVWEQVWMVVGGRFAWGT